MSGLSDGELVDLPGQGHMLPLTHPEFVSRHIASWVGRVAADPAEERGR